MEDKVMENEKPMEKDGFSSFPAVHDKEEQYDRNEIFNNEIACQLKLL